VKIIQAITYFEKSLKHFKFNENHLHIAVLVTVCAKIARNLFQNRKPGSFLEKFGQNKNFYENQPYPFPANI
jgi:hypothetical protein